MDKILELVKENMKISAEQASANIKEQLEAELEKRITSFAKLYPDFRADDLASVKEVLYKDLVDIVETKFEVGELTEVTDELNTIVEEAKTEAAVNAIPEELKQFVTEDGKVDEEKIKNVNTAIAKSAKEAEFEAFKETDFIKNIKDAEVTMEKFDELKDSISEKMFESIMDNTLEKAPAWVSTAFVKPEEPAKGEGEKEEKTSPFQSVVSTLDEEQAEQINAGIEAEIDTIIADKKERAHEREIPEELIFGENKTEEQFREDLRGKFEEEFINQKK